VDSGLARSGGGWAAAARPRSQSAGPAAAATGRKSSLPNRQVAALRSAAPPPTPEVSRKRVQPHPLSLADDEASDTENEQRQGARSG
jgi:hypothetical protein